MHRFIISLAAVATTLMAWAVDVNNVAGTLSTRVSDTNITSLTVTGTMDARDFSFIANRLNKLTTVDLSGVTIEAYEASEPLFAQQTSYEANTIPSTAFFGKPLTSMVLPTSVKTIGFAAFAGTAQLESITFPVGLDSIGSYAFSGSGLKEARLSWTVKRMGRGIFSRCPNLTLAVLPSGNVPAEAFMGCTSFRQVVMQTECEEIGDYAFAGCSSLSGIDWTKQVNLKRIGTQAFAGTSINTLNMSGNRKLTQIGDWAFSGVQISSVKLPASLTQVGEGVFYYSKKISEISLPTNLTSIGSYALAGTNISNNEFIPLQSSIETIGDYAFYNLDQLTTLQLPGSLSYVGAKAMAGMTGLDSIRIAATTVPLLGDSVWAGVDQSRVRLFAKVDDYATSDQWQEFKFGHFYYLGDVNNDGLIDVSDITAIISYILGNTTEDFTWIAADINDDGVIDATDISRLINIINGVEQLTIVYDASRHTNDYVWVKDFDIAPGKSGDLELNLTNTDEYIALQCDIELPQGLTLANCNATATSRNPDHTFVVTPITESVVRVLGYSMSNKPIGGSEGAVMTLQVLADDQMLSSRTINVTNVVLADPKSYSHFADNTQALVGSTTGVDEVSAGQARVWASEGTLFIETAAGGTAQLVNVQGMSSTLELHSGRNEYRDLDKGVWIVRIGAASHKVVIK